MNKKNQGLFNLSQLKIMKDNKIRNFKSIIFKFGGKNDE